MLYEADLKKRFEMYYHMSDTLQIGMVTSSDYKNQEELAVPFADAMQYSKDCFMGMVFNAEYLRAVLGKFGMKDMWSHYLKWATEGAFEFIRRTEFPDSYSRMKCNYFYDNLEDIKRLYEEDWSGEEADIRNKIHLFEMELDDTDLQKRDMLLFDEAFDAMADNRDINRVLDCARRYFSGQHTDSPVWEILTEKSARAVRDITEYIRD